MDFAWHRASTQAARAAIDAARTRYLSPVSLDEVVQKARLRKWPQIVRHVPRLEDLVEAPGLGFARLDAEIREGRRA